MRRRWGTWFVQPGGVSSNLFQTNFFKIFFKSSMNIKRHSTPVSLLTASKENGVFLIDWLVFFPSSVSRPCSFNFLWTSVIPGKLTVLGSFSYLIFLKLPQFSLSQTAHACLLCLKFLHDLILDNSSINHILMSPALEIYSSELFTSQVL